MNACIFPSVLERLIQLVALYCSRNLFQKSRHSRNTSAQSVSSPWLHPRLWTIRLQAREWKELSLIFKDNGSINSFGLAVALTVNDCHANESNARYPHSNYFASVLVLRAIGCYYTLWSMPIRLPQHCQASYYITSARCVCCLSPGRCCPEYCHFWSWVSVFWDLVAASHLH